MTTSGHWEVKKNGKNHFCMVSGGYVLIGTRPNDAKHGYQVTDNETAPLENFQTSNIPKFLKQVRY